MRTLPQVRLVLLALGISLLSCGCGSEPSDPASHPAMPEAVRWNQAKPNPLVGSLRAAVVERPGPDRAWIEVQWEARNHTPECAVAITLPDGVLLLEGDAERPLADDEVRGTHRWLVEYPLGRPLDAVLRYCRPTPDGMRMSEVAVRLTE